MKKLKPFFVMRVTQTGEKTAVETRFGRWFGSIDSAARLASSIGGHVYKRCDDGVSRLVKDCAPPVKEMNARQLDGWRIGTE